MVFAEVLLADKASGLGLTQSAWVVPQFELNMPASNQCAFTKADTSLTGSFVVLSDIINLKFEVPLC